MTDQPSPPNSFPPSGTAPANQRPLPPGAGRRLRRLYLTFLVISVLVVLIILSFVWFALVSAIGQADAATLLVGGVVITTSSACLLAALLRGHSAVHGDWVSVSAARTAGRVARVGALIGWLGALAVLATGTVQHYQHVDRALLEGVILAATALIPAVSNDSAHRITG